MTGEPTPLVAVKLTSYVPAVPAAGVPVSVAVPVVAKIPGSELALARKGGAEHTLIDFIGEVKDDFGSTVTNVRDHMDIKLTDATAAELAKKAGQKTTARKSPGEMLDQRYRQIGIQAVAAAARYHGAAKNPAYAPVSAKWYENDVA